jgi:dienelactone hydrolase
MLSIIYIKLRTIGNLVMKDRLIIFLLLLCFSASLFAKELSIPLNNSLHGLAEYTEGDKDKPAVLILHGILQTRNFSTTQKIGDFLDESGYTTLRPTISLGVDSRKTSLACEAIHTHTMESDIEEIAQWVQWLKKKHQKIILLGHSAGASQLVAYLDKYKNTHITPEKVILVSLAYFGNRPSSNATSAEIDKARKAVAAGQLGPASFGFIYCNNYVSPPEAYLSYIEWSQQRVTEGLINISSPVSLLFGAGDKRIEQTWPAKLSEMGMDVHITDEANHFFHGSHEFDLLDFIENAVDS